MLRRTLPLLAVLLIAGCGGSTTHSTTTKPPTPSVSHCPGRHDYMGCAAGVSPVAATSIPPGRLGLSLGPSGPKFPDVSSYQGHPNWAAARPYIAGGVAKAGEYVEDPDFAWNIATLKALHLRWAAYWFVRNTGCAHEGAQIVAIIRSVGGLSSGPVVLDMEVPEAAGYAPCLDAAVFAAFHRHAVIYTGSGTWPGGSSNGLGLWDATYGPSPSLGGLWTTHLLAWQFAAPPYVYFHIPGFAYGDVSVDYGLFGAVPKPGPSAATVARWRGARDASLHAYRRHACTRPVLGPRVCGQFAWRVVHFQRLLPGRQPACFGKRARPSAPVCQIARPAASVRTHAARASWNAYQRHGCLGPASPTPSSDSACVRLQRLAQHFERKAHQTVKEWS